MLNRIFVMIMLLMSVFSLNAQKPLWITPYPTKEITPTHYNWALTYRLPAWKIPLKYIEGGYKSLVEVKLHHLAGNAMLILRMLTDYDYAQKIRENEMSHHLYVPESLLWAMDLRPDLISGSVLIKTNYALPVDVVHNRNSRNDLYKIMTVFAGWKQALDYDKTSKRDTLGGGQLEGIYNYVSALEEELTPYRELRKLGRRSLKIKRDEDIEGADFFDTYYPNLFPLAVPAADEESSRH